jgi:hypothetical protein
LSWSNFVCLAAKRFNIYDKDKEKEPSLKDDHCKQECTAFDSDDDDLWDGEKYLNWQQFSSLPRDLQMYWHYHLMQYDESF